MFGMAKRTVHFLPSLVVASLIAVATPAALGSNISFVDVFKNINYQQTGNGNSLALDGTFFSAELNASAANAYSSASVMLPGGSVFGLPQVTPTTYLYQSGFFPDQAAMDVMFPTGVYTFTGTNGPQTDTATLTYGADDYSQTLPYLTGNNYSNLQGLNASHSFTFNLSPFTPGGGQTDAFIFLTVFNQSTGNVAFTQEFLPSSVNSITMNGGTLAPGTSYVYELDFSDRDIASALDGGQFPPELGFDVRTDGAFTTAVATTPEPSSLLLLGTGLVAGFGAIRRRLA